MSAPFADGFAGQVAVVTGGGTGMGRELVRQLTAEGCDVATCDVMADNLAGTVAQCAADGNTGNIMTFIADVSDETQVLAFRDAVAAWRPHVNLLFNNAGIGGGGSVVNGDRAAWDKTFAVCWYGVYYNTRAFIPLLLAAERGHVVNTSSVNGFWATVGPGVPHTAYSAAKFAVKGFTEALIGDFRQNAPHLAASVVMPGHIGTSIMTNSGKVLGFDPAASGNTALAAKVEQRSAAFIENAPTSAAEAATIILDGVRQGKWRILVGEDAETLDVMVRDNPLDAYEPEFVDRLHESGAFHQLIRRRT
jgi:NAD(P)-dependent dehydrogenase (short-subunit alcohol dehydrogenase family)